MKAYPTIFMKTKENESDKWTYPTMFRKTKNLILWATIDMKRKQLSLDRGFEAESIYHEAVNSSPLPPCGRRRESRELLRQEVTDCPREIYDFRFAGV